MAQKIRVLMCGSDLKSVKGGMVTVVSNYLSSPFWSEGKICYIATHTEGGTAVKILRFAVAFVRIFFYLLFRRADLVHLHVAERGSFWRKAFLVCLCRLLRVPVILHHHGAEFEDFYGKLSPKMKGYVERILEMADCNIVLSDTLRVRLLEKAPDARVEVIPNAVDVKAENGYRPRESERILMLGVQGKRKGSYDLLQALSEIENRLPARIKVWMCGDGDTDGVWNRARELGIAHRIAHVGWVSGEEKEKCLENGLLHVLPSYREALPMSILETMGRGIPNISTNIASIPEVIQDGRNGYLIEPGDVKALAERILWLVESEKQREMFSRESYALIRKEFSMEACVTKLERLYRNLTKRNEKGI